MVRIKLSNKMEGHHLNPAKCVAFVSWLVAFGCLIGVTKMWLAIPNTNTMKRCPCPTMDTSPHYSSENDDTHQTDQSLFDGTNNVIEDKTTSITFSETFYQTESKNSNPKITRTNIVDSSVIVDAINNPQISKDEVKRNLSLENLILETALKNYKNEITRTNIVDSSVIVDAIDNPQISKDEEIQNLTFEKQYLERAYKIVNDKYKKKLRGKGKKIFLLMSLRKGLQIFSNRFRKKCPLPTKKTIPQVGLTLQ
jgi:hypothetical protein